MISRSMKTNAVRQLESLGIPHQVREYDVDSEHMDAELVASMIGLPPQQVFKTLVARGDRNGVCLAVVPADAELDPRALARHTGDRRIELVTLKEVQPLTGYVRGGVTALGLKREFPVFADQSIATFDIVSVSAGVRGAQILLAPADYLRAAKAVLAPIARHKTEY